MSLTSNDPTDPPEDPDAPTIGTSGGDDDGDSRPLHDSSRPGG